MRAATWSSCFFAEWFFFSEYLVVWRCYFILITTSWQEILFLTSYFFEINAFSAQLLFHGTFFSRISNYSEHVLFWSRCLFSTTTSSERERERKREREQVFLEYSLFLIVLRNQFHSFHIWKDLPLTNIHSFKYTMV